MTDRVDHKQPCLTGLTAHDFVPLFAQLSAPAALAPLDAGLVTLAATMNSPQFRRLHPTRG